MAITSITNRNPLTAARRLSSTKQPNASPRTHQLRLQIKEQKISVDNSVFGERWSRFTRKPQLFSEDSKSRDGLERVCTFIENTGISQKVVGLRIMRDLSKSPFIIYCVAELLCNAIDAIKSSGEVTLTVIDDPDSIELLCFDNGHGIRYENTDRIFEARRSYKEIDRRWMLGYSGVALFYIEQTLKLIKGEITVLETSSKGTSLRVKIPKKLPGWFLMRRVIRELICITHEFYAFFSGDR